MGFEKDLARAVDKTMFHGDFVERITEINQHSGCAVVILDAAGNPQGIAKIEMISVGSSIAIAIHAIES